MKKLMTAIILNLLLFSCNENQSNSLLQNEEGSSGKNSDSLVVNLKFGKFSSVQNSFSVMFDSIADSRCPEDVTCFWQGNVEINLILLESQKFTSYKLNTVLLPNEIFWENYKIKIINVQPVPNSTNPIIIEDYLVKLLFIKNL